jgi:hypothetical protein
MSARTATRRRHAPAVPEFHPGQLLDWRAPWHWGGGKDLPCRYCGKDAWCRDSKGHPAHKVCAEDALAKQYAEAIAEYRGGQL